MSALRVTADAVTGSAARISLANHINNNRATPFYSFFLPSECGKKTNAYSPTILLLQKSCEIWARLDAAGLGKYAGIYCGNHESGVSSLPEHGRTGGDCPGRNFHPLPPSTVGNDVRVYAA
uniref:(northern house mosquito) hypothetical protein n=1 Tax=Culex pipiens TaxID=7175 RepID=A0A8D8CN24_CULPI